MLSLISDIYKFITGSITDVKNWILRIIQAVYSFITRQIDALAREVVGVWNELYGFILTVQRYAIDAYDAFLLWIQVTWRSTLQWFSNAYNTLNRYIDDAILWLDKRLAEIVTALRSYIDNTIRWIQKNILDPLIGSVGNIIAWLQRYGMFMYYLLTHPDALASLIGRYLWSAWLDLLKRNAQPIASWLLHAMLGVAGTFADVLETIITAML